MRFREQISTIVISILMFSATSFYTVDRIKIYLLITFCCTTYVAYILITKPKMINSLAKSGNLLYVLIILGLVSIDAALRINTGVYNFDFTLFTCANLVMFYFLLIYQGGAQKVLNSFGLSCEIAAVFICIYILINEHEVLFEHNIRLGDTLSGNVNSVAMNLGIYLIGITYLYVNSKRKRHIFVIVIVLIFMLLTGSKKAFFSIVSCLMLYIFWGTKKSIFSRVLLISSFVFIGAYFIFTNEYLYNIIGSRTIDFLGNIGVKVGSYNYSNSTYERSLLIAIAWDLFLQSPLIGSGFNIVATQPPYFVYAHSNYMEMLASYGLTGFIIYYGPYFYSIIKCFLNKADRNIILFISLILCNALYDTAAITYTSGWMCFAPLVLISAYFYRKDDCLNVNTKNKNFEKFDEKF